MVPELMKVPPEEEGQLKPEGVLVSLAQEWMPPRVCTPIRPGPTPEIPPCRNRSPFRVPSRSTTILLDWVELVLAFCTIPPPPRMILLVILVPCTRRKPAEASPWTIIA